MFIGSQFVLPQNSIKLAMDACKMGSLRSLRAVDGIGQIPLGALVPARSERLFPSLGSLSGACCSSCADHPEEGSCCSSKGMGNLSDSFSSVMDSLSAPSPILGLPWTYVAGGAALLFFLFGTRVDSADYKYERAKASRDYKRKLRALSDEYPSRGRRAGQHVAEGYRRASGLFG